MTTLNTMLASLIALTSFAACSTQVEDADQDPTTDAPIIRLADYDGALDILDANEIPRSLEYAELADFDAGGNSGGFCECTTPECVKDYVLDTYGCGICVDAVCDGEPTGGCFSCDDDPLLDAPAPDAPYATTTLVR